MTKDAVSTAVGGAVGDGVSELVSAPGYPDGRQCMFRATGGRGMFTIDIWPATPELVTLDKEQAKGFGNVEDVGGLGDSAFTVGYNELHVAAGQYLLKLALEQVKYHPDTSVRGLTDLARASVGKL